MAIRGIELLVEWHSASALSGWFAYAYGKTRYTDVTTTETFWADFDQRHTFSLFGLYRMSDRTTLGVTFRAGSNFPIPGYFEAVTMGSSWAVSGTPCDCPAMPGWTLVPIGSSSASAGASRSLLKSST